MPTISSFYGILIMMFQSLKEHNPPHIHAYYAEYEGVFLIETGELLYGHFPLKGRKLVKEFIKQNKSELQTMWNTGIIKKIKGLE